MCAYSRVSTSHTHSLSLLGHTWSHTAPCVCAMRSAATSISCSSASDLGCQTQTRARTKVSLGEGRQATHTDTQTHTHTQMHTHTQLHTDASHSPPPLSLQTFALLRPLSSTLPLFSSPLSTQLFPTTLRSNTQHAMARGPELGEGWGLNHHHQRLHISCPNHVNRLQEREAEGTKKGGDGARE